MHQQPSQAAPALRRGDVHAPDMRLVAHLQFALAAHAHHAGKGVVRKHAKHRAVIQRRDPSPDVFQCQRVFLFVTRSDRFRGFYQGVQAQLTLGRGIRGGQTSDKR
ncbi:hypothetical protein G6F31_020854 [Rhizopus arrhizus]|nr:hypothetical protein G6F31_020854 [Rhizopus arrhizus]